MQAEIAAQNDRGREVNIGQIERVASVGLGAALVVVGLALRSRRGLGLALTGAGIAYRGLGGRCLVYRALGIHGASGKPTTDRQSRREGGALGPHRRAAGEALRLLA